MTFGNLALVVLIHNELVLDADDVAFEDVEMVSLPHSTLVLDAVLTIRLSEKVLVFQTPVAKGPTEVSNIAEARVK